jgi:hypothetical protein
LIKDYEYSYSYFFCMKIFKLLKKYDSSSCTVHQALSISSPWSYLRMPPLWQDRQICSHKVGIKHRNERSYSFSRER